MTKDQLVSQPLDVKAARAKCEEAADVFIERFGGHAIWVDDKSLRVYARDGKRIASIHMEQLQ